MKKKNKEGISNIFLTFIGLIILESIISVYFLDSYLNLKRTVLMKRSNKAFFAAEGALFGTLQQMRADPDWPLGLEEIGDSWMDKSPSDISGTAIERKIIKTGEDNYEIIINSDRKSSRRQLVGYYSISTDSFDLGDYVSWEEIERKYPESFVVANGESYSQEPRKGPDLIETIVNDTGGDIIVPEDIADDYLGRWHCHGLCPEWQYYYLEVPFREFLNVGDTVRIGRSAILDDTLAPEDTKESWCGAGYEGDTYTRRLCIIQDNEDVIDPCQSRNKWCQGECSCQQAEAAGQLLHYCDEGVNLVAPPCVYTVESGEEGWIEVHYDDSAFVDVIGLDKMAGFHYTEIEPE